MSHTKQLKAQYEYNTKQVLYLTGMSEAQYFAFMTDTAYAWLEYYWSKLIDINALIECNEFLSWWKLHWFERDDKDFLTKLYHENTGLRNYSYRASHQMVFNDRYPLTKYMIEDFRAMRKGFESVIKKQQKHRVHA